MHGPKLSLLEASCHCAGFPAGRLGRRMLVIASGVVRDHAPATTSMMKKSYAEWRQRTVNLTRSLFMFFLLPCLFARAESSRTLDNAALHVEVDPGGRMTVTTKADR